MKAVRIMAQFEDIEEARYVDLNIDKIDFVREIASDGEDEHGEPTEHVYGIIYIGNKILTVDADALDTVKTAMGV